MQLHDIVREADFGSIALKGDETEYSFGIKQNSAPRNIYGLMLNDPKILTSSILVILGKGATQRRRKSILRNFLKYDGVMAWYDHQDHIGISSTITRTGSTLKDLHNLYKGVERIAQIKEKEKLRTATVIPANIMERMGWKFTFEFENDILPWRKVPVYEKQFK